MTSARARIHRLRHALASPAGRIGIGIAVVGISSLLAVAADRLPFLVFSAPGRTVAFPGGAVTDNLHYMLVATGAVTGLAGLLHALGRPTLRAGFLVSAGVSALFTLLCWLSLSPRLDTLAVSDHGLQGAFTGHPVVAEVGNGFTLSLLATGLLLLLGAVNLAARPAGEAAQRPDAGRHSQR